MILTFDTITTTAVMACIHYHYADDDIVQLERVLQTSKNGAKAIIERVDN